MFVLKRILSFRDKFIIYNKIEGFIFRQVFKISPYLEFVIKECFELN